MTETHPSVPFRWIAEYTYDWETWVDVTGRARWINPAVERLTGYSPQECLAMADYPLELVHEDDRIAVQQVLARASRGVSGNHHEFRILRADGSIGWGAVSWQPISDERGQPLGYRTSVRDIEARKRMEAELRQAVHTAEVANHAKTQFLANVSHELRTPLQSILGFAELMLEEGLPERNRQHAEVIMTQGRQLERLVLDLLDYSSLQVGAIRTSRAPFEVNALLRGTVRGMEPRARAAGLELHLTTVSRRWVSGDAQRVTQVLTNLLDNALKFTNEGEVRVSPRYDEETEQLVVTVDDTGPGLPAEVDVFAPFQRGTSETNPAFGVGLGLALSRQLCRQLGGDLLGEESPQGGARFRASFVAPPVAEPEAESLAEGEQQPRPQQGTEPRASTLPPRILGPAPQAQGARRLSALVVDDVEPARRFLQEALELLGQEVHSAGSAKEALAMAQANQFDLVLVDLQMPDLDGWQTARHLRAHLGRRPFFVALSASGLANDPALLAESGFDTFEEKPLGLHALRDLTLAAKQHRDLADEELTSRYQDRALRELPAQVERCRALLRRSERPALARAIHDLAGLLALARETELTAQARALEVDCQSQSAASWRLRTESLLDAVTNLAGPCKPASTSETGPV